MATRPSEPLLHLLRTVARKQGLNTAALARAAGLERARLKHVLSGSEPLTVDELMSLSEVLELSATDLAGLPGASTPPQPEAGPALVSARRGNAALATVDDQGPELPELDPFGNHAEQILKLGFALGVDIYVLLDCEQLSGSGVPAATLQQYPDQLPLRLDAAYHRHHDPRFLVDGIGVKLSFDALYDCEIPWGAFRQVTLFPLPPEPPDAEPPEPPPEETRPVQRGHLRLVE